MPWDFSDAEAKDRVLTHAIADMSPAMAKAQTIVAESIDRRFEEQSDGEKAWAPLSPVTIARRKKPGMPILQQSQDLRRSMKGSHDRDSAEVGPSEDVAYAGVHADGSRDGKIPQRDYLALKESEIDEVEREIFAHLESAGG